MPDYDTSVSLDGLTDEQRDAVKQQVADLLTKNEEPAPVVETRPAPTDEDRDAARALVESAHDNVVKRGGSKEQGLAEAIATLLSSKNPASYVVVED